MAPKGVGKGPRLPTAAEKGAAREKVERDRAEAVKAGKEQAEANRAKRMDRRRTQSVVRQLLGIAWPFANRAPRLRFLESCEVVDLLAIKSVVHVKGGPYSVWQFASRVLQVAAACSWAALRLAWCVSSHTAQQLRPRASCSQAALHVVTD